MNKDDILALLRKNPKLTEAKSLVGTQKIADAYLNQISGGLIQEDSTFSDVSNGNGFSRYFGRGG